MNKFVLFFVLYLLIMSVNATTYYVSESLGNDSWSGLLATPDGNGDGPKKTIVAADAILDGVLAPGDSVLFKRGDIWTATTNFISLANNQGTVLNPIVIGAYSTGNKPVLNKISTGNIINIRGSSILGQEPAYFKFENIKLTTTATPGQRPAGISIVESFRTYLPHHITFENVDIIGCTQGATIYHNGHIFKNCYIGENFKLPPVESGHSQGIYASGDSLTFVNNHFENNGKENSWFDWNMYLSKGNVILVEGNTFNGHVSGIKIRRGSEIVIRENELYDFNLVGVSIGGDANAGISNVLIENNIIYNSVDGITIKDQSGGGPMGIDSLIVRNNILHSNRKQTIPSLGGGYPGYISITNNPIRGVYIYNNLVYNITNKFALSIRNENPINSHFKNNIFHRSDDLKPLIELKDTALTILQLDANLYYCDSCPFFNVDGVIYNDLIAFTTQYPSLEAMGQEGNPEFKDPLNNDFHLTANSNLAIDKGSDALGLVDWDIDGNKRPLNGDSILGKKWDIGPYEFDPQSPITITRILNECAGFSISVGSNTYISTGVFIDTLIIVGGYDSIITTDLTITTIDTTTTITDFTISANETGATYQWIDCKTGMPILNETNQSFTTSLDGSYAVKITKNGCIGTSSCVNITKTGINQVELDNISIYPNPITEDFTIDLDKGYNNVTIQVENTMGQIVSVNTYEAVNKISYSITTAVSGIYFVSVIINKNTRSIFKIIKR